MLCQPVGFVLRQALVGFHESLGDSRCVGVGLEVQLAFFEGLKLVQPLAQSAGGLGGAGA